MTMGTSCAVIEILQIYCSVRGEKAGRGWPLASNMEIEAKLIAKSLTLFNKDEIAGTNRLYLNFV